MCSESGRHRSSVMLWPAGSYSISRPASSRLLIRRRAARVILLDDDVGGLCCCAEWIRPERKRATGGSLREAAFAPMSPRPTLRGVRCLKRPDSLSATSARWSTNGWPASTSKENSYEQQEDFYLVTVPAFEVTTDRWTDLERRSVIDHRWWTLAELASSKVTVYPESLVQPQRRPAVRRDFSRARRPPRVATASAASATPRCAAPDGGSPTSQPARNPAQNASPAPVGSMTDAAAGGISSGLRSTALTRTPPDPTFSATTP